jgi:glycosyltransferase involved in cell wall biosynthesis
MHADDGTRIRLCIDAGPTENAHRLRGIGSCTRQLLAAMTPDLAAAHGVEVRVRRGGWTAGLADTSPRLANWSQLLEAEWTLPRDVAATGADVFLATDPHAVALSPAFATVSVVYDVVPLVFPELYLTGRMAGLPDWLYRRRLDRQRRAAAQIAISEATRADAVRLAGFDPTRMTVVPLGVDARTFCPRDPTPTRPYLLFVGATDVRKNLAGVLAAHDGLDIDLVVVGTEGPPRDRVRWLGHVDDAQLPGLYAGALAFVFPSLYEGFGLPILEAMSCGTPVVTARLSAIPEVAGDAALYADPQDLRPALQRIIADPALRADLRRRGLQRAAGYSWRRTAEGVLAACRAVATNSPGWRAASRGA